MLGHVALSPRLEDGTSPGSLGSSRRLVLTTLIFVAALTACGGSSTGSPSAAAATPSATAAAASTPAPHQCPSAGTVGSALGITLPAPTIVPGSGGAPLPPGATGVACDYHGQAFNVIIELISNISPSYIAQFSGRFPVPYASVSGVGDQARSFSQSLSAGKDNEGVVATKGSTLVAIIATSTPASLMEIEGLANQLL
jgi:hypothetical protein